MFQLEAVTREWARQVSLETRAELSPTELLRVVADTPETVSLLRVLARIPAFEDTVDRALDERGALTSTPAVRQLRCALGLTVASFTGAFAELARALELPDAGRWRALAASVAGAPIGARRLADVLLQGAHGEKYEALMADLTATHPHAVYPTSTFRESAGSVTASPDHSVIEATMTSRTYTSIRISEGVLDPSSLLLADVYRPFGRCVALVDSNVERHFGRALRDYFTAHGIELEPIVVRAMEVDKAIGSVERILGDFKARGVSRNEPVLIVGGGVLADIGGLACALYHRSTPYVMLGTSIVSGIDAGPSPRTCCDGFGYKNLFGAYHAPSLSITDRTFFRTLREGWLRHGVAEIVKMAVVKDEALFEDLESAGIDLVRTRFGTHGAGERSDVTDLSRRILGGAMKSYVSAEYGNLYETHQARPHAYGHTWSPGFEIAAGLLHGHAVGIGMGFGAFMAERRGWIRPAELDRIVGLIERLEISLWHDVLHDTSLVWGAQEKMVQKRGGVLAAPVPRGAVGACGYIDHVSRPELEGALRDYAELCAERARGGRGVEPLCADVGLEDPSTVFVDPARAAAEGADETAAEAAELARAV
ncbi:MAG: sedoheptulose 7-phosphate cyclase [Planctomycetota bacterium]